jgi:pilus assembly protein CpaE
MMSAGHRAIRQEPARADRRSRSLPEEELQRALRVPDRQGVSNFAETYREAIDIAKRRQPTFILIEIDRDVGEVAALSKELQELVPEAAIAGAFRPDRFEEGQSEGVAIIELLRAQMRDFLRRPLSTTELRAVLDRLFSRLPGAAPVAQGRVAAFLSNKGGVGKSTLAVNVACGLALRHPDDVSSSTRRLQVGTARCRWICSQPPASSTRFASGIAL